MLYTLGEEILNGLFQCYSRQQVIFVQIALNQ